MVSRGSYTYPRGLCLAVLMLWVASLAGVSSMAEEVDDETCLACHDGIEASLMKGSHALESMRPGSGVSCVSCHSGGEVHIEDPTPDNIGNPGKALAAEAEAVCTACHIPHADVGTIGLDPHRSQDFSCGTCHQVHGGNAALLIDEEGMFCQTCHAAVTNQFRRRSNHPLTDQAVTCMSCHSFTGESEPTFGHGPSANCATCHPEQGGPYIYEHQATSSFSTEGDGCTGCHEPHGSSHERLLMQGGNSLCTQCHGTPPLHRTRHGGIGTQYACYECHSATHGSQSHRSLLNPQLGTLVGGEPGSCFCHNIEE